MYTQYVAHRKKENVSAIFTIRKDTSDHKAIEEVWKKNSYQRKLFKIGGGEKWLDLGANIGAFSVYASMLGNEVMSYEADSTNASICSNNIITNGAKPNVVCAAIMPDNYIGDTVTFYKFSRPMALRRHSIYKPLKNYIEVTVPVVKWSQLPIGEYKNVKMNIEGVEIELLENAKNLDMVNKLVLEYSWDKDPNVDRYHKIIDKLKKHFRYVDANKPVPKSGKWLHYPPNIFIYCKK